MLKGLNEKDKGRELNELELERETFEESDSVNVKKTVFASRIHIINTAVKRGF